jgi:hypothetical protein
MRCPSNLAVVEEWDFSKITIGRNEGHLVDATSDTRPVASAIFDDPNLVSCAGLVPVVALAQQCDLGTLADRHLTLPADKQFHINPDVGVKKPCKRPRATEPYWR